MWSENCVVSENEATNELDSLEYSSLTKTGSSSSDHEEDHVDNTEVSKFVDETRDIQCKFKTHSSNYLADLCEIATFEVSLEGLDGITIEALWTRISIALEEPYLTDSFRTYVWENLKYQRHIEFYELENPRPRLIISDRNQNTDDSLSGDSDDNNIDIYEYNPIFDINKRMLGSCKSYYSRKLVSNQVRQLSWFDAYEKYGNKLVIVASHSLRKHCIFNDLSDPCIQLTDVKYCLLERIGRSRKLGEVTYGKFSLQCIVNDAKSLFYFRKILADKFLITKQLYTLKVNSFYANGNILHLNKFFQVHKTKMQMVTEKIINILKNQPEHRLEYKDLKNYFDNYEELSKIWKSALFQKFIRTDVIIPYRVMYPKSCLREWKLKKKDKERHVRVMELIDPYLNVASCWNEEENSELSSGDDEPLSDISLTESTLIQIFYIIFKSGSSGISLKNICYSTDLDYYSVRAAAKVLIGRKLVGTFLIDREKQRIVKYYVKNIENETTNISSIEKIQKDKKLLKKANEHLSDVLGIDKYHLTSNTANETEKIFENSLQSYLNVSNNCGILISKLQKDLNYHRVTKKTLNDLVAEFGNSESSNINSSKENIQHSEKKYKELLDIESRLCKNNFDFDPCKSINNVDFFPSGVPDVFRDICSKIVNDDCVSIRSKNVVTEKCEMNSTEAVILQVPDREIYSFFKSIFIKNIQDIKNSDEKTISKFYQRIMRLIKLKDNFTLYELEERLQTIIEETFQYKYYKMNENVPIANYQKIYSNNKIENYLNSSNNKRKMKTLNLQQSKKIKLEDILPELVIIQHEVTENFVNSHIEQFKTSMNETDPKYEHFGSAMDYRLMGVKPVFIKKVSNEKNIDIFYYGSTPPISWATENSKYIEEESGTINKSFRVSAVLEKIKEEKVFLDVSELRKFVFKMEKNKGYKAEIDRKSLERIIGRLVTQGFLKVFKIVVKMNESSNSKYILCHPSIDIDYYMIQTAVDQMALNLSMINVAKEQKKGQKPNKTEKTESSDDELRYLGGNKHLQLKCYRNIGRTSYGYCPKFLRAKIIHKLLFDLVYGEQKQTFPISSIFDQAKLVMDENSIQDLPPLYTKEVCPEMFISPLPHHKGWPQGWALIADVIIRLPISIFCQIIHISHIVPNLESFLSHNIKKYLPIKYLPLNILKIILNKRRYLYYFNELMNLLCHMGLLQYGPPKMKHKDKMFVYLNRNASLLDTASSNPGYHQVEDKNYKKISFYFKSSNDVERYWHNLFMLAMQTPLGQRYAVLGETIQIDSVYYKPAMVKALTSKTIETAPIDDNGHVPGDRKGAGGLDSSLWVHNKRNWSWHKKKAIFESSKSSSGDKNVKKKTIDIKIRPMKYADFKKMQSAGNKTVKPSEPSTSQKNHHKTIKKGVSRRKIREVRKVVPRRNANSKKGAIDDIDRKILKKLKYTRSIWYKSEDDLLLILRAVTTYFSGTNRSRMIPVYIIRDTLHTLSPISSLKTARACLRRIAFLKRKESARLVLDNLRNFLYNNSFINRIFGKIRDKVFENTYDPNEYYSSYIALTAYLFYHQEHFSKGQKIIQSNFQMKMNVDYLTPTKVSALMAVDLNANNVKNRVCYFEPTNEKEIMIEAVKTIIHSSMNSKTEKIGWTYQMFQVYQRYSDTLLRKAVMDLRESDMISLKRKIKKREKRSFVTATSFQFNFRYTFTLNSTKFPIEVYTTAIDTFKEICTTNQKEGYLLKTFSVGNVLGLSELVFTTDVEVSLEVPPEPLALNPTKDHKGLIKVLATRYKRLLMMTENKKSFTKSDDNEKLSIENKIVEVPEIEVPALTSKTQTDVNTDVNLTLSGRALNSVAMRAPGIGLKSTKDFIDNLVSTFCTNLMQEEMSDKEEKNIENVCEDFEKAGNFECDLEDEELKEDKEIEESLDSTQKSLDSSIADTEKTSLNKQTDLSVKNIKEINQPIRLKHVDFENRCEILSQPQTAFSQPNINVSENEPEIISETNVSVSQKTNNKNTENKITYKDIAKLSIPTIMEEIAKDSPDEERLIPRPIKLMYLLKRGLFPDDNIAQLDKLDENFSINLPKAHLNVTDDKETINYFTKEFPRKCTDLLNSIKSNITRQTKPLEETVLKEKFNEKFAEVDFHIVKEIAVFVQSKKHLGATFKEIQKEFCDIDKKYLLELIRLLKDCNVILMTGVNVLKYIHNDYRMTWLCASFSLKKDEPFKKDRDLELQMYPWIRINGTLNRKALNDWLQSTLTCCLSYPLISLDGLAKELAYLKRVEVYRILQYLQQLGCVNLIAYETPKTTLFSTYETIHSVPATEIHDFEEIFVEVDPLAVTKLGIFMQTKTPSG